LNKVSLETALNAVCESQPLTYTISENTIIVRKKSVVSVMANETEATAPPVAPIKGKVTDDKGQPLEGATVLVKGTPNGTKTDASGNFSIEADANATLIISYVGFITVEVKAVAGAADVQLKPQANSVEAVVVVGYGTSKKRDLTGSISSVKGEEVAKMPATNPISSLQGKVPGINCFQHW
jgi:hypothetical protein